MKKLLLITTIAVLISSCGSTKNIPAGAPPKVKDKELREKSEAAQNQFRSLEVRANGHFEDNQTSQGFRVQVRILKDSLVWVDIADPILGIKVARAVIYRDSVAFVNRLQKEYYTGPLDQLQQKLNMNFGFEVVQAILSANLTFETTKNYETYYQPGYYVLADHIPGNEGNREASTNEKFHEVFLDPVYFKPAKQKLEEPGLNRKYEILFQGVKPANGMLYPDEIRITYTQKSPVVLKLEIRDVEKDKALNYPFSIPAGYDKMR